MEKEEVHEITLDERIKKALYQWNIVAKINDNASLKRTHKRKRLPYYEELANKVPADTKDASEIVDDQNKVERCRPWNHQDFQYRLSTFEIWKWFAKPQAIGAYICARYGWKNIDIDKLQCVSCEKVLNFYLKDELGDEATEAAALVFSKQLDSGHSEICPWKGNPSPESFANLPFSSPNEVIKSFQQRVVDLSRAMENNPADFPTNADIDEKCLNEMAEFINSSSLDIFQTKLCELTKSCLSKKSCAKLMDLDMLLVCGVLCICGWERQNENENEKEKNVLHCWFCNRKIGLWNFSSTCSIKSKSNLRERDEKQKENKKKKPLNPITEHRWFCPWQKKNSYSAESSSASVVFYKFIHLNGWKRCLEILKHAEDEGKDEDDMSVQIEESIKPDEVFRTVRKILDMSSL